MSLKVPYSGRCRSHGDRSHLGYTEVAGSIPESFEEPDTEAQNETVMWHPRRFASM